MIVIVTSSLNTEGTTKSHRPSSASLEGTNDGIPHRYILTEYQGKTKIHSQSSASLEGTNDVSRSYKHQQSFHHIFHKFYEGVKPYRKELFEWYLNILYLSNKQDKSTIDENQRFESIISTNVTKYRGKVKIHRPSSASLEGTNDFSRSCKHQHISQGWPSL